jgi:hypothetical protein
LWIRPALWGAVCIRNINNCIPFLFRDYEETVTSGVCGLSCVYISGDKCNSRCENFYENDTQTGRCKLIETCGEREAIESETNKCGPNCYYDGSENENGCVSTCGSGKIPELISL